MKHLLVIIAAGILLMGCRTQKYHFKQEVVNRKNFEYFLDLDSSELYVCRIASKAQTLPNENIKIPNFYSSRPVWSPDNNCWVKDSNDLVVEKLFLFVKEDTALYLTTKKKADNNSSSLFFDVDDINLIYVGKIDDHSLRFNDVKTDAIIEWEIERKSSEALNRQKQQMSLVSDSFNEFGNPPYIKILSIPQIKKRKPTNLTVKLESVFHTEICFYKETFVQLSGKEALKKEAKKDFDILDGLGKQSVNYDLFFVKRKMWNLFWNNQLRIRKEKRYVGFGVSNDNYKNRVFKRKHLKYLPHNTENYMHFGSFTEDKKDTIKEYWEQHFKRDIMNELSSDINFFPIKIDSYGAFYPDERLFADIKDDDFKSGNAKNKDLDTWSIYDIIRRNKKTLENTIKSNCELFPYFRLMDYVKCRSTQRRLDSFYTNWNAYHDKRIAKVLLEKAADYKSIVFFIHGYNVPYSLANIQSVALNNTLKEQFGKEADSIFFIPVFWSSGDMKYCDIDNKDEFNIDNINKITNGLNFYHYNKRAYYAGIALRRILNMTEESGKTKDKKMYLFSHSMGAVVLTTAVINTVSRLDKKKRFRYINGNDIFDLKKKDLRKMKDFNENIIKQFRTHKIPNDSIALFISAGAVSGKKTFRDLDSMKSCYQNKFFWLTYNPGDKMLNKELSPTKFWRISLGSKKILNTSLGAGDSTDIKFIKTYPRFIKPVTVDTNGEHNIFNYLRSEDYTELIKDWYDQKK